MSRRRRRRLAVTLTVLALLVAGGYTAAAGAAALPDPELIIAADQPPVTASQNPAQAAVDAQSLPTAIGWAESEGVWSNDDRAYSLASISKIITVLVAQEARPLAPGSDGETFVWSEADAAQQAEYIALDGVAFPIPVGTQVTEKQMLTLALLPSANDFMAAYARSVFGSNEALVAAVDAWKQKHGFDSLEFVEPTGMDEANRATAADVVRIARLALQNPTITQFTSLASAEMPWGIGTIENTNPMLGELAGVVGLKTGRSSSAGFNLAAAQVSDARGREVTKISVTLGRGSAEERAQSARDMLAAMDQLPQLVEVVAAGTKLGEAVAATGERLPLETASAAGAVLLPGEAATLEAPPVMDAGPDQAVPTAADAPVGAVTVVAPTGEQEIQVVQVGSFAEPDLWWRVTHPAALWG